MLVGRSQHWRRGSDPGLPEARGLTPHANRPESMVQASEFRSRQLAVLARAAALVSSQLSVATVLGLALAALLPDGRGAPASARHVPPPRTSPPPVESPAAPPGPIEVV